MLQRVQTFIRQIGSGPTLVSSRGSGQRLQKMPSGLTQDGISTNAASRAARQAATLTSLLAPLERSYRIAEDIQQGFVFVIGKFPCVHKHAVLFAGFVFKMLLLGVMSFSWFSRSAALDIPDIIVGFAHFRVTAVGELGHPVTFQLSASPLSNHKPLQLSHLSITT